MVNRASQQILGSLTFEVKAGLNCFKEEKSYATLREGYIQ
jgi:hypothetical protein